MQLFKLMGIDEHGIPCEELSEIEGPANALEQLVHYKKLYPDTDFYIEPHSPLEQKKEKQYNKNAADGWEDLYPNNN